MKTRAVIGPHGGIFARRLGDAIARPPVCRLLENCMLLNPGELAEVLIALPCIKTAGAEVSCLRLAGVAADSVMFVSI